ncbi:hypothetical protein [Pelobacter propionicus]|uniref:Uncharacterized protein n=1 Tax=Pelobacter propionicus (strain DSM 2379 / NBRC 103807 / OttBd1) TaxID=338966 RepID=A1AL74_PELPD|nr:hypothetical protein [Pelobacter propionicus]ABK98094.1 hypothetical protein Ppro_0462 [Pelobacter propionicus DSM 2379]
MFTLTKNRQALHVPLSRQSLVILMQRKERNPLGSPWIFLSLYRPQNLNKSGHARMMAAELRARTGLKKIAVHGLREPLLRICNEMERLMVEGVGVKVINSADARGK